MKKFYVYSSDKYENPEHDKYVLARHGFSWPAFFFWWIWASSKEIVGAGDLMGVLLLPMGLLSLLLSTLYRQASFIAFFFSSLIVIGFYFGTQGNKLHKDSLKKNGYHLLETIEATTEKEGQAKYEEVVKAHKLRKLEETEKIRTQQREAEEIQRLKRLESEEARRRKEEEE